MTSHARLVLQDARHAIEAHGNHLSGPAFRVSWFAIVGLLRSIGHVLEKVDSNQSEAMARAIAESWKELQRSKPSPPIFWQFIEGERNRFLKNYEHGITRMRIFRGTGDGPVLALDLANAGAKCVQVGTAFNLPPKLPDRSVVSIIADGPFQGRPEREVALEAVEWWDEYLSATESHAKRNAEA